jgi:hypothetical protein
MDPKPFQTVMQATTAFWLSRSVHAAAQLGLADAIDDSATPEEVAKKIGAQPGPVGRVLRLLSAHGIFEAHGNAYRHNDASKMLRSDHPMSLRSFAQMIGGPLGWACFGGLEHSVKTGKPAVEKISPGGLFPYFGEHPEEAQIFDSAMTGKSSGQVAAVTAAYDFSGFKEIADIGGGAGHLLHAVLAKTPSVKGILFDLPQVVERSAGRASDRLKLQAGDFFKDPLPSCDAYVLMEVIHDWDDPEATKILQAVRKAAPPNAKVLVIENVLPEDPGPHWAKALDITMLVMTGGRERTKKEYEKLLSGAGFRLDRVVETPAMGMMCPLGIIEATPA